MTPPIVTNCTGLNGTFLDMCNSILQQNPCDFTQYRDAATGLCTDYPSLEVKIAGQMGDGALIDTGNTAWMLLSSALVMIMTPGVGLFYGGLAGEKAVSNTIMMCMAAMCIVSIQWFLFGYSFAFGPGNNAFGSFDWACLIGISSKPSGVYGWQIPHYIWVGFQNMFAQITPALIAGAVVGRMKFSTFCVFVLLWTTVVYDPLAHWVWSLTIDPSSGATAALGWLGYLGEADFAGGTVIHISSGFAALAAALVVGKRKEYDRTIKPHNVPMVVIGATMLWFGWFGFNAGSAGGAGEVPGSGPDYAFVSGLASFAFINTHIATALAAITWNLCEWAFDQAPTAAGAASGMVAGLVAITPACGFVLPWHACIIGAVVSPICYAAIRLKNIIGVDDTLDAWGIHGVGGIVGAFCTGLFAVPEVNPAFTGAFYGHSIMLGFQMAGITVAASFSFVISYALLLILDKVMGLRVPESVEEEGIDVSEHGGKAYTFDNGTVGSKSANNSEVSVMGRDPAGTLPDFTKDNPTYSQEKV